MCVTLDLSAFTSSGELEELGYGDPVIRSLSKAIEATEDSAAEVRGYDYDDLADDPSARQIADGGAAPDTHRAVLQSQLSLYVAVRRRLETLALSIGEDPEEVLYE